MAPRTGSNGIGKNVAEQVAKGAKIVVTGRIQYIKWTGANSTRYGCDIMAEQIDFLAKAKEAASNTSASGARSSGPATIAVHQDIPAIG